MMKHRLIIAKSLLKEDGVLICAIDKNEAINYMDIEDDDIYTFIDCAPEGWAKLCEDLCAELKPLLERAVLLPFLGVPLRV